MKPACRKSSSIGQHKWRTVPSGTSPHRGLQSISDSICPVHDFCLYYSVPNWVCKGGMPSTCKEIKQLERPRLALFVCSLRKKQLRCPHPCIVRKGGASVLHLHPPGTIRLVAPWREPLGGNHNPTSLEIIPSRRFPFRLWVRRRRILRCVEQFIEFF